MRRLLGKEPAGEGEFASEKETGRLEAFSDGVFAIAITLLVLDMKVPHPPDLEGSGYSLLQALLKQWPAYIAFVCSFLTILVMWVNHHRVFNLIRRADDSFLFLNGLLLLGVTAIPFPTALTSEYIAEGGDNARVAAQVLSGLYIFIALCFNGIWRWASYRNHLLHEKHDIHKATALSQAYRFGPLFYVVTFAITYVHPMASVVGCLVLAIFFALPFRRYG